MAASNYDKTRLEVQSEFCRHNAVPMAEKFRLQCDEQWLYLTFLSQECRIDRQSGKTELSEDGFRTVREADFNTVMTLFDILIDSAPGCAPAGRYVRLGSLPGMGKTASKPVEDTVIPMKTQKIEENPEAFRKACLALGGEESGIGDISFRIPVFSGLCAVVRFWYADEDFPAQLQILWDEKTLQYIRFETVWYLRACVTSRLFSKMDEY